LHMYSSHMCTYSRSSTHLSTRTLERSACSELVYIYLSRVRVERCVLPREYVYICAVESKCVVRCVLLREYAYIRVHSYSRSTTQEVCAAPLH